MSTMPTRWLNKEEQQLWRAYLGAFSRLDEALNNDLVNNAGIDLLTYEILVNLSESPDTSMRMSELAKKVSAQKSRLTYRVTLLEQDGWVQRRTTEQDGRGLICVLLDEGFSVLERFAPLHVEGVLKNFIEPTSTADIGALTRMFDEIAVRSPDESNEK